jgi:putative ABC transport system permease protein
VTGYIVLSNWDLALASILILIDAGLSVIFGLHIHRSLLVAALRMTVQLLLVGLVLTFLFTAVSPLWTGLCALVMILFAGHEVAARQERRLSGWWSYSLGTGCMMASSVLVTTFALLTALRPDPWYDPRYAIPLLGMILGNCMTGIALGLDTLTTGLMNRRDGVEARLMLGATRWQAARPVTRDALRSALMPIVNSMSATGVVSLPGMMTGQILSGVPPAEAVKYQILVMFLIAGGTGFAVAAVIGGVYRLTDSPPPPAPRPAGNRARVKRRTAILPGSVVGAGEAGRALGRGHAHAGVPDTARNRQRPHRSPRARSAAEAPLHR